MEKTTHHIDELFSGAGDYLETKTELWKLKIVDKASDAISSATSAITIAFISIFFFIIINIGIALLIGDWTGKSYYGFFIVAGFYALVGVIIYLSRETWLKVPVSNMIIRKFFK